MVNLEMFMKTILVEDDPSLARAILSGLEDEGIHCLWFPNAEEAWSELQQETAGVAILDIMLPETDGLMLLEKMRKNRITTPVLLLTALGSIQDRVVGLNAGADDYLVKPFEMPELIARLHAIARRSQRIEGSTLAYGPLRLELTTRRAFRDGKELGLSPTEMSLLELFMRRADQVVTRRMLCEQLWDSSWEGETNVIEVHINRLRGKVDKSFPTTLIHTVRGRGYVLSEKAPTSSNAPTTPS